MNMRRLLNLTFAFLALLLSVGCASSPEPENMLTTASDRLLVDNGKSVAQLMDDLEPYHYVRPGSGGFEVYFHATAFKGTPSLALRMVEICLEDLSDLKRPLQVFFCDKLVLQTGQEQRGVKGMAVALENQPVTVFLAQPHDIGVLFLILHQVEQQERMSRYDSAQRMEPGFGAPRRQNGESATYY